MPWSWSCHKCHTRYPLGATRRCLHDGHNFCGGITTNQITGKTKRHKACRSEFDYHGWEILGRSTNESSAAGHKDCPNQCDFPSACHWRARQAKQAKQARKPASGTTFDFLDPSCLETEVPVLDPIAESSLTSLQKRTGQYANRFLKAAENKTIQAAAFLSKTEDCDNVLPASTLSTSAGPPGPPTLNGLRLSFPVMDFAAYGKSVDGNHERSRVVEQQAIVRAQKTPPVSTTMETSYEDIDIDMTDWISDSPSSSPETSPTTGTPRIALPFDFRIEPDHCSQSHLDEEEDSPISPFKMAWNWSTGGIGIALTTPPDSPEEAVWEVEV